MEIFANLPPKNLGAVGPRKQVYPIRMAIPFPGAVNRLRREPTALYNLRREICV